MVKRFSKDEFESIYSRVPRICLDLVIKNSLGEVLLTYRKIYPSNIWHLPGGTVFVDETLEEAAHRIAREELSSKIKIKGFIGYIDFIGLYDNTHKRPISLIFEAELLSSPNDIRLDYQASTHGFFMSLPEKMDEGHRKFLLSLKE